MPAVGVTLPNLLINKGADINAKSDIGTPLTWASMNSRLRVVQLLVEKGADLNLTDSDGETALDKAQGFGRSDVVAFLKERNALSGSAVKGLK